MSSTINKTQQRLRTATLANLTRSASRLTLGPGTRGRGRVVEEEKSRNTNNQANKTAKKKKCSEDFGFDVNSVTC